MAFSIRKSKQALARSLGSIGLSKTNLQLAQLRRKYAKQQPGSLVRFLGYEMRITDGLNFYIQYKDEFIHRIYHFEAERSDPLIIDGGSNMGMSALYFKHIYPRSRIIGFEPDLNIFRLLQENIERNRLEDVTLIDAGLGAERGTATFEADDKAGGQFVEGTGGTTTVRVVPLSEYVNEPVDFLKLNIEGQELPVLQEMEATGKLSSIKELVLEYHGWAGGQQRLGAILSLLDRAGFRYLVHDFDSETGHATKPPFRLRPEINWFCLVYAKRVVD